VANQSTDQSFKLILAGIGGQGVIFATRLLSMAAIDMGMPVIASESHGMSQRGGSVLSHLILGGSEAPLVRRGMADAILGFDRDEAYRNLDFLRDGGSAFINSPSENENEIETKIAKHLVTRGISITSLPCTRMAMDLGSVAVANVILIGLAASAGAFPFTLTAIQESLREMAVRGLELNLRALELGHTHAPPHLVRKPEAG
jgi:indolepyruvate ferredoxin oxidoreductase beta subunit